MANKVALIILDGWGHSHNPDSSAIELADTSFIDSLYEKYPHTYIHADGEYVGLPHGQMGNSEVGHMTIGAGKVIDQDLVRISKSIQDGSITKNPDINNAIKYAKTNNKSVHLLGLISSGGVHSHIDHLFGLLSLLEQQAVENVYIHGFTDGRDCDPKSGINYIQQILDKTKGTQASLASIIGRFYAMDRDKRWERVSQAYNLLVKGQGIDSTNIINTVEEQYLAGTTDEFLPAIKVSNNPKSQIQEGDVVIFFNYRTDRGRQLTEVLTQNPINDMNPLDLHYLTMTCYDPDFKNVTPIFTKENIQETIGELVSKLGKTQARIAETEKYPHVTFFFNGGREEPFPHEKRIICPSPKVQTYDLQPEMNASCVTAATIQEIQSETDFICTNFANADMVGHTGNLQAAIQACETIDKDLKSIVHQAQLYNYTILITADHGNCETMKNPDGTINTSHTTNKVPFILIPSSTTPQINLQPLKSLANIKEVIMSCLV